MYNKEQRQENDFQIPNKTAEESTTNEDLQNSLSWIKDNLTLIAVSVTLVGGIWQLLELLLLGIPYVRFFSASQLLADGIIVLLISLIGLLVYGFSYTIEKIEVGTWKGELNWIGMIVLIFLHLLYLFLCFDFIYLIFQELLGENLPFRYQYYYLFLFIGIISIRNVMDSSYKKIKDNEEIKTAKANANRVISWLIKRYDFLVNITYNAVTVFFYVFLISITFWTHNYVYPTNMENTRKVEEYLCKEYFLSPEEYTIEYMNDKFIFIKNSGIVKEELELLNKDYKTYHFDVIVLKENILFD
ncbi:hypothetical protein [Dokdonia sp. Asnod1-B02]|uniref:hypothetical protein n=1 Tax=Dokdonia sp. Asnod1-B02 TaxID=3160573 RepID=UPI003863707F